MISLRGLLPVGLALFIAACAELPKPVVTSSDPEPEPAPTVDEVGKIESQPLKYLKGRNLKPLPTRALNVKSRCSARDAAGTATRLDLLVKDAEVKAFDAQISIKGQGLCRFNLKDFRQAEKLPQALLKARDGSDCSVRMWEEGARVTVAFNSCAQACEKDAFSYLWPIVIEAKSGRCF